jgi:hypothetical protein
MKPVKCSIGPLGFPVLVLVLGFLVGCATTPIPGASHDLLKFLQIGQTTREEAVLKLGQPSASFEQEKILTYRLGEDSKQGYYLMIPDARREWQGVHYSLVLVFDSGGVLQRQSLVAVQ